MAPYTSLLSLVVLLLLPRPLLFYSFKLCKQTNSEFMCHGLTNIPQIPKSATGLDATRNNIQNISPTDLTGFYRLQTLDLKENNISHIEDEVFKDLLSLTRLILSENQLTELTDNMFKGLSGLLYLNLKNNKITSISSCAFQPVHKLQSLYLMNNHLVRFSDVSHINIHCSSLEELYIGYNNISSLQSHDTPFQRLKQLSLRGNNLTLFDPESLLLVFSNLTYLSLASTPLRRFSVHSNLVFPRLKSLDLSFVSESVFEWDVSDKSCFTSLTDLNIIGTNFTIETYQSIFQTVESVERLSFREFWRLFDQGLLDFACRIPALKELNACFNNVSVVNDSLLQFCKNVQFLDLSQNGLTDFTVASLRNLSKLNVLRLNENALSRVPAALRHVTTLKSLWLEFNRIKELRCSDFTNLTLLTELYLYDNEISKLSSCVFQTLTNLKSLDVGKNHLNQIDSSFDRTFPRLKFLSLAENRIARLHTGSFQNLSSLLFLYFQLNGVTFIESGSFVGLDRLKSLSLTTNQLQRGVFAGLPSLERLSITFHYLSNCEESEKVPIFNLPSLQTLDVRVTNKDCGFLSEAIFKSLDKLTTLISDGFFCVTPHPNTFLYSPHLEQITIKYNLEFDPAPELFHPLSKLKTLKLTNDKITSIDFLFKANLTKLETLILQRNEIRVINETVFEALPSLKYLSLSGNPFACDCSNAGFIDWVIRNEKVQVVGAFEYTCWSPASEKGHFLLDFHVHWCWEFPGFLCFISTSALVLLTLLSSFCYHFLRWQLVYGFYLLQAFLYNSKKKRQGCADAYDAFVSYNVHDEDWVYGELVPELEGRRGWRLCLHHRDFQPGKAIIENITDAIYSSRKTLCVISRHYLQSEWCSREIQMASFRLFDEQKDVLVLLFLEEISSNQLSPFYRMRKLVKSRTYLSWTQTQSHKGLFWEKVHRALQPDPKTEDHQPLPAHGTIRDL